MVAIVGQTGCGKSTFLNLVIGLDRPSQGRIAIGGRAPYDDFDHFRGVLAPCSSRIDCCRGAARWTTCDCRSSCFD